MINLVCPTLDLFIYHLQEGGVGAATYPQDFRANIVEQGSGTDPKAIKFLEVTHFDKSAVEFEGQLKTDNRIKGSVGRFALDENYGLALNISVDGKFNGQEVVQCLEVMLTLIPEQGHLPGKLGQTWMVSGWVENPEKDDREILANDVYQTLIEEGWQYQEKGQFLGGTVFEFWRSSPQRWEKMEAASHLILILYPNQKAMETGADFHQDWKGLFCYRNKILWAYGQSRELKEQMVEEFNEMSASIKGLYNLDLCELKLALQNNSLALSNFVNNINSIEVRQHEIDLNLHQYEKSVQSIAKKAGNVFQVSNDFKFLQEFSAIVKAKYQKQLEQDYASLRPYLNILEHLRGTIASIVEISQAQSDRDFQTFACLVGTGIGTAGVVASSSPSWVIPLKQSALIAATVDHLQVPEPWTNFSLALSLSAIAGLLGCLLASVCITWFCPKRLSNKSDRLR
ncbi:hypothetical protein [Laspinema olomoucense]|uniref:Uncharacterized protein n=1 Tax=Laspinema olomoucense D3b TaxID=2953688 RepID=A0ABT2NDF2_9CYAN|nr:MULTISPECIES: hypothetical protein [unclassified Laspinema]MCT7980728.1 hypothetical protein [Laspinema sp. D3b]MCT7988603.1 hypothetical protein [Laspinema sp. D3a]